ncbi:MAG TPA: hypothetical protein VF510_22040 [Ktedonobacterales bacterium]
MVKDEPVEENSRRNTDQGGAHQRSAHDMAHLPIVPTLPTIQGHLAVESCLIVSARCPVCGRVHCHVLTARDHLELGGTRYWLFPCAGERYLVRVGARTIKRAQQEAATIARELGLTEQWRECTPVCERSPEWGAATTATENMPLADEARQRC